MKDLYSKRTALTAELRGMLDKWEASTGTSSNNFDAEANGLYKERCAKIEADLDTLDKQIATEERLAKLQKENDTPLFDTRGASRGTNGDRKDDWGRRFIKALQKGDNHELRTLQSENFDGSPVVEQRLMIKDTLANQPVAAVPSNFDEVIRQKLYQENVIRRIAKVTTIDGTKRITIEAALPTTELVAENAAMASPSDPTFGSLINVFPYKFQTKVSVTNEFLEDALSGNGGVGGIMDYIASKIATSMARAHEDYFCNGSGSTQPQGVGRLTTDFLAANRVLRTGIVNTAADITGDNVVDTYFAVAPQYRANGSWLMSDAAMKAIRKLKTATSGSNEYIYKLTETGDLREGVLGVLLGRPVYVSPFYNSGAGASKCFATFGDFGHGFEIFDRSGMNMLVDPYVNAGSAITNMYAYSRLDSKITVQEAFSVLGLSAS